MIHGGEIYGTDRISYDFSVNLNPLGIPENVYRKLGELREELMEYPDQECRQLRQALSACMEVKEDQILCGNGASELIEAAVRALGGRRILVTAPSFSGYRHAAQGAGAELLYHELRREEDFALTDRFLQDLDRQPDMAILCSPANPVGNLIDRELLEKIACACADRDIWLMVDECFLGLTGEEKTRTMRRFFARETGSPEEPGQIFQGQETAGQKARGQETAGREISGQETAGQKARGQETAGREMSGGQVSAPGKRRIRDRLLVLDAFTKRFAMPGIRLGWLAADDPAVLDRIRAQQTEWSVSVPAQTAGLAALEQADLHLERACHMIREERRMLENFLRIHGCRVFPGQANYIFFTSAKDLVRPLLDRGILIRDCSNYPGLTRGDYRIAVKTPEDNAVLMEALEEILDA
ncbi:MAG: aminotransferase class I/II-fold pyridoxal phosphate-dependent enzyme [Sarcina sp.]|nr:aminotransferase class I/II-fold pyridoxal phosphate-dependent enzyme [Sarcina sp.]